MFPIIDELLQKFQDRLDTRAILIARDVLEQGGIDALKEHLPPGLWLIAADDNTWEVAGAKLARALGQGGFSFERYEVLPEPDGADPICKDDRIEAFQATLKASGATAGIAVGAGTINDIVKLACHNEEIPMACVGTAPSMNGFTSGIAAVLSGGVKTTVPCRAPVVVLTDIDVMAQSPYRMICSGLGDLKSKPVSNADWQLSAWLTGSFHSDEAMEIIEAGAAMLEGIAHRLPDRDPQAVASLTASLMLSGLAMSVAGSSSPASGGEHLISHYIDMTAIAFDESHDFHGCQVGVGTITTAYLYEQLQALDPDSIDVEARVSALMPWNDYQELLKERFGPLFDSVVTHAYPAYPSVEELRQRLTTLKEGWSQLKNRVGRTLQTSAAIEAELKSAGCPLTFQDIGVDPERAYRSIVHSKDIRNRYTILHLAWELGHLDEWAKAPAARL